MRGSFKKSVWLAGGVLLAVAAGAPGVALAKERDDATARRQAMDEWYNESYSQRGKGTKSQKYQKQLWPAEFQRFMLEAAKRERQRSGRLLPIRRLRRK